MGKSRVLAHIANLVSGPDTEKDNEKDNEQRRVVQINCVQLRPGCAPPESTVDGQPWTVLLDGIDQLAQWPKEERDRWIGWIATPQPSRTLVLAGRRPIHQSLAGPDFDTLLLTFQQKFLGLIDQVEATRIVRSGLAAQADNEPLVASLVEWCGGHPFLLDQVADLFADIAGMLPATQALGPLHLPLLRMRLAAAHGRMLFDSQWRAIEQCDAESQNSILGLLRQLMHGRVPFDALSHTLAEPMNWLLIQGLVGVDDQGFRLFSPLLKDYLAPKLPTDRAVQPISEPSQDAIYALVERETHRFTPQEKALLLYFLDRPRAVISIDELLAEVWHQPDGSVRRVQEGIRRLRHRLAEFEGGIGVIENEWGQGYRYLPVHSSV